MLQALKRSFRYLKRRNSVQRELVPRSSSHPEDTKSSGGDFQGLPTGPGFPRSYLRWFRVNRHYPLCQGQWFQGELLLIDHFIQVASGNLGCCNARAGRYNNKQTKQV